MILMAKVNVTVISSTKQAYNSAMRGARILKRGRDVYSDQKTILRAKVMVKVTMTFRTAFLLAIAMYNMIQVSDIGPSWPSCCNVDITKTN